MQYRQYQIEKSAALGLLLPQSLRLEVKEIDLEGHEVGLLYETTTLRWWECMATMPPKFLLLSANKAAAAGEEVNAAIAKVMRPLANLPPKSRAKIEMGYISECFKSSNDLPYDKFREWHVQQQGFKRRYHLKPGSGDSNSSKGDSDTPIFSWRGSGSILQTLDETINVAVATAKSPKCHGNLKLLGPDGQLLAVWKQRRDSKILGSLYVLEAAQEWIPVEVVIVSCLYVVVVERILWTTFFGG